VGVQRPLAGVLIGLASAAVILGADSLLTLSFAERSPFETIELKTYDWRMGRAADPSAARSDIALIEIDEYSLRNLEPVAGRWPWPRIVHGELLDYLARAPARVVAYDVLFAEPDSREGFKFGEEILSGRESDEAFVGSVRQSGNVILLADATFEGEAVGHDGAFPETGFRIEAPGVLERKLIFPPFSRLAAAAAGLGHNLFTLDPDGPLRHTVPFVRMGGRVLPSFGLSAALRALPPDHNAARLDDRALRVDDRVLPLSTRTVRSSNGSTSYLWGLINFHGPALLADLKTRPYASHAFFDLIYSEEQIRAGEAPKVDPSVFKDKIVFVGVTAAGLFDVFETPFAGGRMPGIQVNAAVADDILSNRFLAPLPGGLRVATVLGSGLAIGLVATAVAAWWAAAATIAMIGMTGWLAIVLFAHGAWLNLSQPVLTAALALFGGVAYQYFVEGREKRKMKRLFGQYVSKDVYERLVAHPELARLGGQRRDMTVLFSDIRGFTTVTECGQPEEIVGMLNEYFTRMVEIVFRHKGTLDKFVGDMVMALFNAPLDDPEHADHAVEAALDMIDELQKLNERWASEGRFAGLDIGIGINTGPMIAGNIGSDAIMSYTVIGDAVNLGSRLESLNKQYGTRIIISDATRERLTRRYQLRALGEVVVKGKTAATAIYEVMGRGQAVPDTVRESRIEEEAHP
jgi:adenylate cyclase